MNEAGEPADAGEPLPPRLAAALAAFERYLRAERSLSPHTVRAYTGDIRSLLEHVRGNGIQTPDDLDLAQLRSWLAVQHSAGAARTTLARRGAAARTFTALAYRRGWLAADPGPRLGTLKTRRVLPHVLRQDEMEAVLGAWMRPDAEPRRSPPAGPGRSRAEQKAEAAVILRDAAVLELFYATGIRVSELCGLDADSLDHGRRTVRVRGKGDKERTVPVGVPALRAVSRWLAAGRPVLATSASGPGPVPGRPRRPPGSAHGPPDSARALARDRNDARRRTARHPPQRGDSPARGRRRPAQRPGDSRPCLARDHPDIHARLDRAPQVQLPPGPSPGVEAQFTGLDETG